MTLCKLCNESFHVASCFEANCWNFKFIFDLQLFLIHKNNFFDTYDKFNLLQLQKRLNYNIYEIYTLFLCETISALKYISLYLSRKKNLSLQISLYFYPMFIVDNLRLRLMVWFKACKELPKRIQLIKTCLGRFLYKFLK